MKVKEDSEKAGLKLGLKKLRSWQSGHITSWQMDGGIMETVRDFIFLGSNITADGDCSHEIKTLAPWKKSCDKPRKHIKNQRYYFADKGLSSQSYGFSSSHIWMWELDYKESWEPKNWCFWTVMLEETLESPLDCKQIKPVHPKGNRSWKIHWKDWCWSWNSNTLATWCEELTHWKRPWCWERVKVGGEGGDRGWDGWMHHQLNGHEFEWTPAAGNGQGGLACCGPWARKESDMTERLKLNWTEEFEAAILVHILPKNSNHTSIQQWTHISTGRSKTTSNQLVQIRSMIFPHIWWEFPTPGNANKMHPIAEAEKRKSFLIPCLPTLPNTSCYQRLTIQQRNWLSSPVPTQPTITSLAVSSPA